MQDNYTPQELNEQKERIKDDLLVSAAPDAYPHAYLLAGQPGAGKTKLADICARAHGGNIIFISSDDYRRYHPRFTELQAQYGDDAVLHTQQFAGKMTEALIDDLSLSRYHLIIEGTLRTTEVPLRTHDLLAARGYDVFLNVILVRPEKSYLSTQKRYRLMEEAGLTPRMTPREHHDRVMRSLVDNLHTLYEQDTFQGIRIYNRAGECLYDKEKTPFRDPSDLFREEFSRELTSREKTDIEEDYALYVGQAKVEETLRAYAKFFSQEERGKGGH